MALRTRSRFDEVCVRTLPLAASPVMGRVRNLSRGVIDLDLKRSVPANSLVDVEISEDCTVQGKVSSCRAQEAGFRVRVHFQRYVGLEADLRSEPRFHAFGEAASISAIGCHKIAPCRAKLLDISRSGLGMLVDGCLPVETWVKVELEAAIIFGDVRHCSRVGDQGFRVGLATETVIFRNKRKTMDDDGVLRSGLLDLMRWLQTS